MTARLPRWLTPVLGGVLAAVVVTAGTTLLPDAVPAPAPPQQSAHPQPAERAPEPPAATPRVPAPVSLALPTLGVRSSLDPLQLEPDGELAAPARWSVAGWYTGGPRPGERGPAVVAGHVDGPDGPAVFWRLAELRPGDPVEVVRADGSTAVFAVTGSLVAPKDDFPTAEVYGPTPHRELRLITCDGAFDRDSGHYLDNLVVFATQVGA